MKAVMSQALVGVLKSAKGRDDLRQGLLKGFTAPGKTVKIASNGQKFNLVLVARKAA